MPALSCCHINGAWPVPGYLGWGGVGLCLIGLWWIWAGTGRPRCCPGRMAGCRRRCPGRRWRGRWTRPRWRICAGIWRITCWRRSGCGKTAARRCRRGWPAGGCRRSGRCSAPGPARDAYQRARDRGLEVVFRSADPGLLGLPWELMRDGGRAGRAGAGRDLPEPAGRGRGGDAGGAGGAAAGADGDRPPGRDGGCGVSDGGPAAAGAAGRGPRRGRPDGAAPADVRGAGPGGAAGGGCG